MKILNHRAVKLARWFALLLLVTGSARVSFGAEPVFISEFLASNNGGLKDEDGDSSDWIEIFNSGTNTVNLDGWFLTDSASNLRKWRIPGINLAPNGFLIVFASGKNRAAIGRNLHANFSLNASGEYLALVHPDGVTIANDFAPTFPEQLPNISYGVAQDLQVTKLLSNSSPAKVLIPTDGALGNTWLTTGFDDSAWRSATNGVGYETYVPGFAVRNIRANVSVCDLTTADSVLGNSALQAAVFTETRNVVNYLNTGSVGNFGSDFTFPGFTIGSDVNNFVLEATGILTIPTSGIWTFGVNSDEGFRVVIGANTFSYPGVRGAANTFAAFNLAAGDYPVRLVFFECAGSSEVEFFAAPGNYTSFNSSFRLVGDIFSSGLAVKSVSVGNVGSVRPLISTDVQTQMLGTASSAFVRLPFNVANPAAFSTLTLRMQYDDGFVAYLNGTEIARRNSPPGVPSWDAVATANRLGTNALVAEDIDVSAWLNLLQPGPNVLAIQGLAVSANATDFVVLGELMENKVLGLTNHYFATPSPGAVNSSGLFAFVENLKFNPGRGWFDTTNFSVTITSATPGVTIRYTTNGTVPSVLNGITYLSNGIPVGGTTLLRAIGYRNGFEPTELETHSYIFLNQVQAQSTNSNWAGGSSGNYTLVTNITRGPQYGPTFKNDLLGVPTLSIVLNSNDIWGANGFWSNPQAMGVAWERPCSLEYMRPDGKKGFHINCGIRVQGGASRSAITKHGMRVLFKTIYGSSKLDYELYDSPVHEFDTLTLHGYFIDQWLYNGAIAQMQRDQWCRDAQNAMGGYGPHGVYAHVYLNGIYWGMYNIGEKGDASYAASYLGGEKEEYDAVNSDEIIDGDSTAWNAMLSIANAGVSTDAAYNNLAQYLNIPNFIDYMLMNFYAGTGDWPFHNWNAARRRVSGAGFHFFSWDAEWSFGISSDVNINRTGLSDGSPGRIYNALRGHPEFRVQFGDHVQKHLFNGGALTPVRAEAMWMNRATEIDRAVVGESSRWSKNNINRDNWLSTQTSVRSWFPQRGSILLNQLRAAGLFPSLSAPLFTPFGGIVTPGYSLALNNPNASGIIYFTRDGSDPRAWGGALTPTAQAYSGPLSVTNAFFLRARVRDGANWSAIVEAPFYAVQDLAALKVTEIMYNPPALGTNSSDDLEFLELKNTGTNILDLSGFQFTDGLTFSFTNGTRLAPGAFFVLAHNASSFAQKYPGVTVNGIYAGKLDNGGEKLTLSHVLGTNAFSFTYNNVVPWPITPDGYGFSLVRANINGDPDLSTTWRPSAAIGGSPGADDPASIIAPIVINEILTHTLLPQIDAIELFNPTLTNVNIGGWFLSDAAATPKKFRIPEGTIIPPGGFAVFRETDFNATPGVLPSFALSSRGESLFLFSGNSSTNLSGYSHSFDYGASANGVSFGRYVISTGDEDWPAMSSLTLGGGNSEPRIGPVVINEVMYHPPAGYDEFVELYNLSGSTVSLFDVLYPTNTWRLSGLNYTFSNNVVMPGGSYLLVVATDPAAFRAKYFVPAEVQIVGPYPGVLQDSGERLRLERPDTPDTNGVPYIVVDEVRYNDKVPWPTGADGDGPSLQRRAPTAYGNEPTNWFASGISPGAANVFNQSPVVALVAPTNGAAYVAPVNISLVATAADFDGFIVRVEFYDGDIKIGETTSSPYSFTWTNPPTGAHTVVAKARDNRIAVSTSGAATIAVNPPPLGTGIGLRGDYYDNVDFTGTRVRRTDALINFDWSFSSPDPLLSSDTFSVRWTGQVQPRYSEAYTFYTQTDDGARLWVNGQLLIDRWVFQNPAAEWSGTIALQAGVLYDIRLEYYDDTGTASAKLFWSSPNQAKQLVPTSQLYPLVSNVPPMVTLTGPATGSVFVVTSPVNVTADAMDPDGTILRVEFFANNVKIGEDTTAPFAFSWTNAVAGSFNLTARVTDDGNLVRTSAVVNVVFAGGFTTNVMLVATNSDWKYLDNGTDQGSVWSLIAFNDSGWSNGPAELGYGDDIDGRPERTVVNYGPDPNNKYITTYFRRAFTLSDPPSFNALNLRVMRDDGVVVYLNGSEIYRNNLPSGAINYRTLAPGSIGGVDEYAFQTAAVNPGFLVYGTNVIAAEVHQSIASSPDLSFDLELTGLQSFSAPYFTVQPQSQNLNAGATATFSAIAGGSSPLSYQWRFGGTDLTGATNASLVRSNVQSVSAGDYTLVISNIAGSVTSQVATLIVVNVDTDGDGLPDAWELAYGLNPSSANDAGLDADGDGMTNLQEYRAGTNPTNASSALKLSVTSLTPFRLQFVAWDPLESTCRHASLSIL